MAELEQEGEQRRVARVKELEEMVKKLESENRQLLNKVRTNSPTLRQKRAAAELQKMQDEQSGASKLKLKDDTTSRVESLDDLEDGVLDLEQEQREEPPEDEWLFVSPKLPPTPVHKKMSPLQWLSEGHNRNRETDLPSLSEVRKTLEFGMNEVENLFAANRIVPGTSTGAESPPISPTLRGKLPENRTAQKYIQQVRQRRNSPPSFQMSHSPSGGSPLLGARSRLDRDPVTQAQPSSNGGVPVVKWKAKLPPEPSDEEEVPQVKWKVNQVPSEIKPLVGDGGNLKVRWNPSMADQYSDDEDEMVEEEARKYEDGGVRDGVQVVKWKARVPEESGSGGNVPVVKWKAKVPAETKSEGEEVPVVRWKGNATKPSDGGDVPVVRWKAKVPAEEEVQNEDIPVVRWKAKVPVEDQSQNENIPVVRWKVNVPEETKPQKEDVPVVRWKAKMPAEAETQNEDVPVVRWKHQVPNSSGISSPNQKHRIASPKQQGRSLAPPSRRAVAARDDSENSEGVLNGDSDFSGSDASSTENLRVSRYTAHKSSALQRRSPGTSLSPKLRHSPQTSGSRSRSPSPPSKLPGGSSPRLHNSHVSRSGLAPPRQGGTSLRNLSPSSQGSNSSLASSDRSPAGSPGGGGRKLPRKQIQVSSSSPSQRVGNGKHQSGLSHSSQSHATVTSQQQRTLGVKGSPSAPAVARSGLTPPSGQEKPARRMLPTPPSAGGAQQQRVKQQSATQGTSPKRTVQQRARPVPQQQVQASNVGDDDDSWLEGCF